VLPSTSNPPKVLEILPLAVTLLLDRPSPGSDTLIFLYVETKDINRNFIVDLKIAQTEKGENKKGGDVKGENEVVFVVENLLPRNSYCFRCRGESKVGSGPASIWTDIINTPAVE
jgi:hypothetical protein